MRQLRDLRAEARAADFPETPFESTPTEMHDRERELRAALAARLRAAHADARLWRFIAYVQASIATFVAVLYVIEVLR